MVCEQLTGDSWVMFYQTPELAEKAFNNLVQPLIEVCKSNGYDVEDSDVCYTFVGKQAWRFNAQELDALDELIGETNVYYEWGSVTVNDDVTHYFAEFSEWVDEGTITFHTAEEAKIKYNDAIDNTLIAANERGHEINRYDQSTWENEEGMTLFSEPIDTSVNYSDAYFGYELDPTFTFRCGEIDVMDKKEYTVFATGGYLKRPKIYSLTIDPTDPDTIQELLGFKNFNEYIDYVLEEEDAEWGQKFVKCNIIPKDQMDEILKQDEKEGGE